MKVTKIYSAPKELMWLSRAVYSASVFVFNICSMFVTLW